jgi:hypothetical protein
MLDEGQDVNGASFGIGAAVNCLFPLNNAEDTFTQFDSAGLHRSRDAGAGAFTPYHNRKSVAKRRIQAGQEIFVSYGENYFTSRKSVFGHIPLKYDHRYADDLLYEFQHQIRLKLLENLPDRAVFERDFLTLLGQISDAWSSRILAAVPTSESDLDYVLKFGTGNLLHNRSFVPVEKLKRDGFCMDNLKPGNSTIAQAGRGAFAARRLEAGDVVAPVPLIHLKDRDVLNMYAESYDASGWLVRNTSSVAHQQLLLNYCFGSPDSSLLLCPYGVATSLINHGPTGDREVSGTANVRLAWSKQLSRHIEWLNQTIETWASTGYAGLSFEIVALRGIEEGEEILMDYGLDWEAAWRHHVDTWHPSPASSTYLTAAQANEDVSLTLRTERETRYPYQRFMDLFCRQEYRTMSGRPAVLSEGSEIADSYRCRVVDRFVDSSGEVKYTAEIIETQDNDKSCVVKVLEVLFAVPRDAFLFRDVHYSRDHQQNWSFRHHIGIPTDLMPDLWKNRRRYSNI